MAKGTISPDNKKPYFKKQSTIDYAKGIEPLRVQDQGLNKHFSNLILKSKMDTERHKEREMRLFQQVRSDIQVKSKSHRKLAPLNKLEIVPEPVLNVPLQRTGLLNDHKASYKNSYKTIFPAYGINLAEKPANLR